MKNQNMKIIGDSDEGIANEGSTSDEVAKHQTKDSIDMFAQFDRRLRILEEGKN